MKKFCYLAFLAAMPLLASAQGPTLTQSDAPAVGSSWIELRDNRVGMHTITAAGANQTWNYANAFVVDDTIVTSFIAPSSLPASVAGNFPDATVATYTPSDSAAVFYKNTPSGFYADGAAFDPNSTQGSVITSLSYDPDLLIVPFPFSMGDTRSHTARAIMEAVVPGSPFPARFVITSIQSVTADATGSLTTPIGTFSNTLRVKMFEYSYDTTYINMGMGWTPINSNGPTDTNMVYNWFQNGANSLLMSLAENPAAPGTSLHASYLDNSVIIGLPNQAAARPELKVFPNPASNHPVTFSIADAGASKLVITDMLGRVVQTENVAGINSLTLSTNSYQPGTYLYTLTAKTGQVLQSGRFVVVK